MKSAALLIGLIVLLPACSSRSGFAGMQAAAQQQCRQTPDQEAARRCEAEIADRRFDQYERERPR